MNAGVFHGSTRKPCARGAWCRRCRAIRIACGSSEPLDASIAALLLLLVVPAQAGIQFFFSCLSRPAEPIARTKAGSHLRRDDGSNQGITFLAPEQQHRVAVAEETVAFAHPRARRALRMRSLPANADTSISSVLSGRWKLVSSASTLRMRTPRNRKMLVSPAKGCSSPARIADSSAHHRGADRDRAPPRACAACCTSSAPTFSHSAVMRCSRMSSPHRLERAAPTCRVTWPECTPRVRAGPSNASSKCSPAVGAATARRLRPPNGLVALGVVGAQLACWMWGGSGIRPSAQQPVLSGSARGSAIARNRPRRASTSASPPASSAMRLPTCGGLLTPSCTRALSGNRRRSGSPRAAALPCPNSRAGNHRVSLNTSRSPGCNSGQVAHAHVRRTERHRRSGTTSRRLAERSTMAPARSGSGGSA